MILDHDIFITFVNALVCKPANEMSHEEDGKIILEKDDSLAYIHGEEPPESAIPSYLRGFSFSTLPSVNISE